MPESYKKLYPVKDPPVDAIVRSNKWRGMHLQPEATSFGVFTTSGWIIGFAASLLNYSERTLSQASTTLERS